jgi:hypothetical protein
MIEYYDENNIPMMNPESIYSKKTSKNTNIQSKYATFANLLDIFKDLNKRRIFEPNVST